jgi:hypothetical protein
VALRAFRFQWIARVRSSLHLLPVNSLISQRDLTFDREMLSPMASRSKTFSRHSISILWMTVDKSVDGSAKWRLAAAKSAHFIVHRLRFGVLPQVHATLGTLSAF